MLNKNNQKPVFLLKFSIVLPYTKYEMDSHEDKVREKY